MSELREWLRRHNLEQYADAFEANDIGIDILPELSERDLEQLGLSLGNRRRLLKAVAGRAAGAASPRQESPAQAASEAERRQVTVLFCDMVGSTALSNAIDPELLGGVIRRYQDAAAGAIGRFGGFVAKFMGDGVLAYFGFPRAFEDAAERAVRAAINILAEVGGIELPDGSRARARIGIATGLVVVGEIVGFGTAQERTIVGDTPNLAARLQALAEPDTILMAKSASTFEPSMGGWARSSRRSQLPLDPLDHGEVDRDARRARDLLSLFRQAGGTDVEGAVGEPLTDGLRQLVEKGCHPFVTFGSDQALDLSRLVDPGPPFHVRRPAATNLRCARPLHRHYAPSDPLILSSSCAPAGRSSSSSRVRG